MGLHYSYVFHLRFYTLEVYSLRLPDLDLQSGVYTLGIYSLRIYNRVLQDFDLVI